jgi:hypothetical protein
MRSFFRFSEKTSEPKVTPPPPLNGRTPLIQLRGLKKRYQTATGEFYALNGIDLDV